ncbi:MAG: bifunctional diaminohydroxyphosphoribosylaminopyrimidine deaminase/5-amino-6-(5-phosphoribosylamino)uracil reductase RibD [Myxococcaceae bacterium]|nr:bifunctional diaminohydroxyphosphoribosylaminopyrimidine deaminase/5-amino-6-(5-phosphoribosylamino)uracil reductase RibD [Myxococcaceae bacterium]
MRLLGRARTLTRRVPRARRAAEFDRAVAEFFMRIALEEAQKGVGRTHPNPTVGAILVKNGRVIARGHHRRAGTAHAEIVAIEAAGPRARGADLYTTLEPCDHWGRTGPCSEAILEAGIKRVITASADPNPLVNGKGIARLRRHGVEVMTGVLKAEADALNRPFFRYIRTGMPWVTLKAAVTLDGKLATATGDSRWVTGEEARRRVHELRDRVDAILVGANTVLRDDPQLTTRLGPDVETRDPVRVVVDSHLRLPLDRKVFHLRSKARTIVATVEPAGSRRARRLEALGVEVWSLRAKAGRVDLRALLKRMAKAGLLSVMVEGGAEVFATLLRERLADELLLFVAPKVVGRSGLSWVGELGISQMEKAMTASALEVEHLGRDLLLRARLRDDDEPSAARAR